MARVVVGADGIRSVARRAVVTDEPVFTGLVVLRGMAPAAALPDRAPNDRIYLWAQGPKMMTTLPLRAGSLVAMDTVVLQDTPPQDLWQAEVPTETLLENFAGFDQGFRDMTRPEPCRCEPTPSTTGNRSTPGPKAGSCWSVTPHTRWRHGRDRA